MIRISETTDTVLVEGWFLGSLLDMTATASIHPCWVHRVTWVRMNAMNLIIEETPGEHSFHSRTCGSYTIAFQKAVGQEGKEWPDTILRMHRLRNTTTIKIRSIN